MKNKKMLIIVLSLVTLLSFVIGFSYAYFTTEVIGNDTSSSNLTTTGTLKLNFSGLDYINLENSLPGESNYISFTVTNSGTLPVSGYQIYFSNVINTFEVKSEMVYELDCTSSDAVTCLDKVETEIPGVSGVELTQTAIAPGTTHTYTLTVSFLEMGYLQDYNQDKMLTFKITINEEYGLSTLIARQAWNSTELFWGIAGSVTKIVFDDNISIPVGAVASWDVSSTQDESIMAYSIDDGLGTSTYELHFQTAVSLILANTNSGHYFYGFANLTTIENLDYLNTSGVTDMTYLFRSCNDLTALDTSNFNTSNVTNMIGMFYACSSLTSLELNNFDTSKVDSMRYMFWGCNDLTTLIISNFDTGAVTNMQAMFESCSSLTSLNVSFFDTSSVTIMTNMFYNCSNLTSLDLASFDTSIVTSMSYMFQSCSSLTSLIISSFDTGTVITMPNMFYGCSSLTSLDVSLFDTGGVTSMQSMFELCSSLDTLNLSSFDTSNVANMAYMFQSCSSLSALDLGTFVISSVTTMHSMFFNCTSLSTLNIRIAVFTSVSIYTSMFSNITNGINIIVKDANAQTWINTRLTEAAKTGNVTIYIP